MNLIVGQQYFGGELRTKDSFLYGRFEARLKSAQGDGLVSSFFTYQDELINGGHIWNEIDIELLGRFPNVVDMNVITNTSRAVLNKIVFISFIVDFDFLKP